VFGVGLGWFIGGLWEVCWRFSFGYLSPLLFFFWGLRLNVEACLGVMWNGLLMGEGGEAGVEGFGSEELLLMAAENLKKSIGHAVRQLESRKVRGEMKLRWSRSLTRQVEALVKIAEALNKIGSKSEVDVDLASYLSALEMKVPRRFVTKRFARMVDQMRISRSRHAHRRI